MNRDLMNRDKSSKTVRTNVKKSLLTESKTLRDCTDKSKEIVVKKIEEPLET